MLRWTGVCLDCADAEELAQFYSALLDRPITARDGAGWVQMRDPSGGIGLNFQAEEWYVPPVWPEEPGAGLMLALTTFAASAGGGLAAATPA